MTKSKIIRPAIKTGSKLPLSATGGKQATSKAGMPLAKSKPLKAASKPAPSAKPDVTLLHTATSLGSEALRQEITALRTQLSRHMAPVTTGSMEEVDALRRVLNDLMEARTNDVIRELVTIRNSAAAAGGEARRIADQMDALLADLGTMKFEAERLEHVDPLIHTVSKEISDASIPDGIIIETLRPGFHTSRGIIVAKALVAVNRRS